MSIFLGILSILAFLAGLVVMGLSSGAIHEIEGLVLWVISALFLVGAAIVEAVKRSPRASTPTSAPPPATPPAAPITEPVGLSLRCTKCGRHRMRASDVVCGHCGTPW